jgi:hypothetical protein
MKFGISIPLSNAAISQTPHSSAPLDDELSPQLVQSNIRARSVTVENLIGNEYIVVEVYFLIPMRTELGYVLSNQV